MSAPGATTTTTMLPGGGGVDEEKHDEDARSVAGSEKSTSSVRSAIPKLSGIKRPESRIGRPCAGQHAKPAVPPVTPTKSQNSSYDYVKKVTEDFGRYKLTDVQEMEEYEEDFFGNRLHTLPARRNRLSSRGPYMFEELDFFGNPLHMYPPRPSSRYSYRSSSPEREFFKEPDFFRKFLTAQAPRRSSYSPPKDDMFKDYFWNSSRASSQSSSYKKESDWSRDSDSFFSASPRRRSSIGSTGTTTSMDALWELHPRRLSEAGLSRHSDSSAVLTEDTDSFIIGQRVWVGGTKPGQIAYIGETQFAPGDWAGIVLDQPIGKNDGSVGGIRYFQCEPKKGVFSRLTRLTRYPMGEIGAGDSMNCTSPSPTNGVRRSPISPAASTRSALSISNTSLASTYVDYKVGDRVIIKSSQGSKIGTLRYMGFSSFANGEWCGVELDEPRGKNDGSVEGKRYFECRPNFGLFAPVSKVSKSPSSRRPGNCIIHPSGLRHGNSRESLASISSSVVSSATPAARRVRLGVTSLTPKKVSPKAASTPIPSRTALQDVLREKQQHIEQLMKERDLERAEITRAASQADEAEQKFANLRQDYEQYRDESEVRLKDYTALIENLKSEGHEALIQLEDERKKTEDLQFKFEEAAITKGDIEVTNEENETRIKSLEAELQQARSLLEGDMTKLTEIQEELARSREENESLKVSLEHANEKRAILENEEAKSIELVQTLQSQLEESNVQNKHRHEDSLKEIDSLNFRITRQTSEIEVATFKYTTEIEEARAKYSIDVTAKNEEIAVLKKDIDESKIRLENVSREFEKQKFESAAVEVGLKKELDKLKMEVSSKVLEIETRDEAIIEKLEELKKSELAIAALKSNLENALKECEMLKDTSENLNSVKDLLLSKDSELEQIGHEKASLEKELVSTLKTLEEAKAELESTGAELAAKNTNIESSNATLKQLEAALKEKFDELQKSSAMCQELTTKLVAESASLEQSKSQIGEFELQLGDYQRKLEQNDLKLEDLTKQKQNLELEVQQLCSSSGEGSAKLDILNSELREKEALIGTIKDESAQQLQKALHDIQQKEIELQSAGQKHEKTVAELLGSIESLKKGEEELRTKHTNLLGQREESIGELRKELGEIKRVLHERDAALKKSLEDLETAEAQKSSFLEQSSGEMQKFVLDSQAKIEGLNKHVADYRSKLEQNARVEEELKGKITAAEASVKELQDKFDAQVSSDEKRISAIETLKSEMLIKESITAEKTEEISKLKSELEALRLDLGNSTSATEEKERVEKELKGKIDAAEALIKELQDKFDSRVTSDEKRISEIETLKSEVLVKESATAEKTEEISKLKSVLEALRLDLLNSKSATEASEKEQNELRVSVKDIRAELESSNQKVLELMSQLEHTRNDVNSNLVSMEGKEKELADLLTNLKSAREHVDKLQEEKRELADSAQNSRKQLESDLKQSEDVNTTLIKELEAVVKVLKPLQLTVAQKVEMSKAFGEDVPEVFKVMKIDNSDEKRIEELREKLTSASAALECANSELTKRTSEATNLQKELAKVQIQKVQTTDNNGVDPTIVNNNQVSNDYKQLLEEKIFVENQVQFLNTIIVDMQKKNEEQKARIEILEMGYSPAAADELKLFGLIDKKIMPTRLYCDICEEFDLHETEDCPQQGADDLPSPPHDKRVKAEPRPYCENCEMFGHMTEDCQEDDQTY